MASQSGVIDLFAGLRVIGSTRGATGGGGVSKATVEISAPKFLVNLDEPELAGAMAVAVADAMRANVNAGAKLDGTPARPLAASTIERRQYRREQGQRGGQAADRYTDKTFRRDVKKHWRERFKAPRAGEFNPAHSAAPIERRAVESGLLLASIVAEPTAAGGWKVFFANNRALVDRAGNSPVQRAFDMRPQAWQKVVQQKAVHKRLEFALKAAAQGKSPLKAAKSGNLLGELGRTAQLTQSIAETAQE